MDSTIYIRTKELCDERGISITKLEGELGLGQYSIGRLKASSNPTIETAVKIAGYFGVSVDYLIGASNIRTKADDLVQDSDFVSLQRARERMTDVDRDRMMAMLQIAFNKAFGDETASVEQYIQSVERADTIASGVAAAATGIAIAGAVVAATNPVTAPMVAPLAATAAAGAGVMLSKDGEGKKRKTSKPKKE